MKDKDKIPSEISKSCALGQSALPVPTTEWRKRVELHDQLVRDYASKTARMKETKIIPPRVTSIRPHNTHSNMETNQKTPQHEDIYQVNKRSVKNDEPGPSGNCYSAFTPPLQTKKKEVSAALGRCPSSSSSSEQEEAGPSHGHKLPWAAKCENMHPYNIGRELKEKVNRKITKLQVQAALTAARIEELNNKSERSVMVATFQHHELQNISLRLSELAQKVDSILDHRYNYQPQFGPPAPPDYEYEYYDNRHHPSPESSQDGDDDDDEDEDSDREEGRIQLHVMGVGRIPERIAVIRQELLQIMNDQFRLGQSRYNFLGEGAGLKVLRFDQIPGAPHPFPPKIKGDDNVTMLSCGMFLRATRLIVQSRERNLNPETADPIPVCYVDEIQAEKVNFLQSVTM